jgi:hypothetical protein
VRLEDDRLIEVSPDGNIVWEWVASDHIDELGFRPMRERPSRPPGSSRKKRVTPPALADFRVP